MIRVWKSIKWQLQAVFYEIRTAAAFFIILNGLLLILPLSACRVIDKKSWITRPAHQYLLRSFPAFGTVLRDEPYAGKAGRPAE